MTIFRKRLVRPELVKTVCGGTAVIAVFRRAAGERTGLLIRDGKFQITAIRLHADYFLTLVNLMAGKNWQKQQENAGHRRAGSR